MKITEVIIEKFEKEGSKLLGRASIKIDDCFVIKNIRIIKGGKNGIIAAMPNITLDKVDENGKPIRLDVAHPVNQETRDMIELDILNKYNEAE